MATTTNYGWVTPDDVSLVKDGAAAIRTLGSSVDTTTKALNPSTTLGDIEYRSSTANTNTRLPIGTTGQLLTVSGGVPAWATVSASGMTLLSTTTLSGASTTISGISGDYIDLRVRIVNYLQAVDGGVHYMRFNGVTTANTYFTNSWSTANSDNIAFNSSAFEIFIGSDNAVSKSLTDIHIPQYANSTTYKMATNFSQITSETDTTKFNSYGTKHFSNITNAVSSLTFFPSSGNYTSGTVYVYGVK